MNAVSTDRAAAVRQAVRRLVADHGLHGASMAAVAKAAGVATGTAYVHYASKEELLIAAYVELKADLGAAAVVDLDAGASPEARFRSIWSAVHAFLADDPTRARFLVQVEASPLARRPTSGPCSRTIPSWPRSRRRTSPPACGRCPSRCSGTSASARRCAWPPPSSR